jgi:uncharacterized protein
MFIMQLLDAIAKKDSKGLLACLKAGQDANIIDKSGWAALHYVVHARWKAPIQVIRALIEHGANIDIRIRSANDTWTGLTPLLVSMACKYWQAASVLVEAGADLYAEDTYGNTPLVIAGTSLNDEFIDFLLEHGAQPHRRNREGLSAIDRLRKLNFPGPAGRLEARCKKPWWKLW